MADLEPFHVPVKAIGEHFKQVAEILNSYVEAGVELKLGSDTVDGGLVAGLEGEGMETAIRNRGQQRVRVAPLMQLPDTLWAWLGYQEEWSQSPGGGVKRVFFRSSSVGIHFGFRFVDPKPQIFRAEWAGYDLKDGRYRFQGGTAAHPHWQFDAVESLIRGENADAAAELAAVIRAEAHGLPPAEFAPQSLAPADVHAIISSRKIAAMHFASASKWWADPVHAHAPSGVQQIRIWLQRTIGYIVQELDRV